jgi:hypothetical protein
MTCLNRTSATFLRMAVAVAFVLSCAGGRAFAQDRGGFTALVDLGVGVQNDTAIEESEVGLSGINFGVGGYLRDDLALMFRVAGTNVTHDLAGGNYGQTSGFVGPSLQYWLSNRYNVEAGVGIGFWNADTDDDSGFGLLLGAGVTLFNRGKHNLQFGLHYAPAFTNPGNVHNVGFTFGYQFL